MDYMRLAVSVQTCIRASHRRRPAENTIIFAEVIVMKPLKTSAGITLDTPVLEKIRALAEYGGRSLSGYINPVLREHLDAQEKK